MRTKDARVLPGSRRSLIGGLKAALLCLLAALAGGCSTTRDIALAPLWTNISTAGGGREVEALAGIVRVRHPRYDGPTREWSVRPFVKDVIEENGDKSMHFLVPFGTRKDRKYEYVWQMLLLARYRSAIDEDGHRRWSLLTIPLNYIAEDESDRVAAAVFPLGGVLEHFLTFDRIEFALFPLFLRTYREGQVSTSFLWPIFNWTYGPRGTSWRIWPLFGRLRQEGRFDRKFFLWPIFIWGKSFLSSKNPETKWWVWPLYGHTQRGTYHAETVAWPFFGWSHDPVNGMWALDFPWPLVRFLRPGKDDPNGPRRSRIWPFWSRYDGDGMTSHWVAWPIVNWRTEVDAFGTKRSQYVIPLWQHWTRDGVDGVRSSWTKLWPLFQNEREGARGRFAFPALSPLWHLPEVEDMYGWLWELVTREVDGERSSIRTWGNLYRREADEREVRSYLSFLWSRRAYRDGGEPCVERSLLFGLLRWRTHPARAGFWPELMAPSFPGPGWPMQRAAAGAP